MNIQIRSASLSDIDALIELTIQLISAESKLDSKLPSNMKDPETLRTSIIEYLNNSNEITLLAIYNELIIGFVQGGIRDLHTSGNVFYLNHLSVDNKYHKKGVGTLLMDAFIETVNSKNGDYIVLQVLESNTPAKNLYKKKGFIPHSTRYVKKLK